MNSAAWGSINSPEWRQDCRCALNDVKLPRPSIETSLEVRKNVFPPSKLHIYNIKIDFRQKKRNYRCGRHIIDIIRDASSFVLHQKELHKYNRLRRPRSQRKKDWDGIIESFGENSSNSWVHTAFHVISSPVVPTFYGKGNYRTHRLIKKLNDYKTSTKARSKPGMTIEEIFQSNHLLVNELILLFVREHLETVPARPQDDILCYENVYNESNIATRIPNIFLHKTSTTSIMSFLGCIGLGMPLLRSWKHFFVQSRCDIVTALLHMTASDPTYSLVNNLREIVEMAMDYENKGVTKVLECICPSYCNAWSENFADECRDFRPQLDHLIQQVLRKNTNSSFEIQDHLVQDKISVHFPAIWPLLPSFTITNQTSVLSQSLELLPVEHSTALTEWETLISTYSERRTLNMFMWSNDSYCLIKYVKGELTNVAFDSVGFRNELNDVLEHPHSCFSAFTKKLNYVHRDKDVFSILESFSKQPGDHVLMLLESCRNTVGGGADMEGASLINSEINSMRLFDSDSEYDPPKRRRNQCIEKTIVSRHNNSQCNILSSNSDERKTLTDVIDSNQFCQTDFAVENNDIMLSGPQIEDNDLNLNALETMMQLQTKSLPQDRREEVEPIAGSTGNNSSVPLKSKDVKERPMSRNRISHKIHIPKKLMCSSWLVSLAKEVYILLKRAILLTPPSISCFPVLAMLVQSHLLDSERDHRVAIVVDRNEDVAAGVLTYLSSTLDSSISIKFFKRCQFPESPELAYIGSPVSRVIVFDGAKFKFTLQFSLLIVLACDSRGSYSWGPNLTTTLRNTEVAASWKSIPTILILPAHPWILLPRFLRICKDLMGQWLLDSLFVTTECDDAETYRSCVGSRLLFLVSSREGIEFQQLIEKYALPHLKAYKHLKNHVGSLGSHVETKVDSLSTLNINYLEEDAESLHWRSYAKSETVTCLLTLKQTQSYAKYDGIEIAGDFLRHVTTTTQGSSRDEAKKILKEATEHNLLPKSIPQVEERCHPLVQSIRKELRRAEDEFLNDFPTDKSLHYRNEFRALIVANSQEAAGGIERGVIEEEIYIDEGDSTINVVSLDDLLLQCDGDQNPQTSSLDQYSHVFHIPDDRRGNYTDGQLPHDLLQRVYAGRIKLLTIIVDETRKLEYLWNDNHVFHSEVRQVLHDYVNEKDEVHQNSVATHFPCSKAFEQLEFYIRDLFSSSKSKPSKPQGDIFSKARRIEIMSKSFNHKNSRPKELHSKNLDPQLHLSVGDVSGASSDKLKSLLRSNSQNHKDQIGRQGFKVVLHVREEEQCTPVVSVLTALILSEPDLHNKLYISTMFET